MSRARLQAGCHALLVTVAGATVCVLLGLVAWSVLPLGLGWRSDVVLSGSMRPSIVEGDVVVSAPAGGARVLPGHVLVVRRPDVPLPVLHRVSRLTEDGRLVTRGDANASEDAQAASADQVEGVARLRVPYVGLPLLWWQQGKVVAVLGSAAGLLLACAVLSTALPAGSTPSAGPRGRRSVRSPGSTGSPGSPRSPGSRGAARRRRGRRPALVGVGAVVVGVLVAGSTAPGAGAGQVAAALP